MRHPVDEEFIYQGDIERARELGFQFYNTGKPCKRGHHTYRRTSDWQCIACVQATSKKRAKRYREKNPLKKRLSTARHVCKTKGIPYDEAAYAEIWESRPTRCPVLGIEFWTGGGRRTDDSAEMDRIIPELGYVRGNMQVISARANRIKNDGTAGEHHAIGAWIEEQLK